MADRTPISSADALTREQLYTLLRRLHGDREQAALKYEELQMKLIKFFEWSGCASAEDLADEVLTRTARKLHTQGDAIPDVEAFVWGVAKRIRQEGRKKDFKTLGLADVAVRKLSDAGASIEAIHKRIQFEKERECLRSCIQRLPQADQEVFLAYRIDKGHYLEKRKQLAEQLGLSQNALRVRIIRLREKLEKCVARCLGHKSERRDAAAEEVRNH